MADELIFTNKPYKYGGVTIGISGFTRKFGQVPVVLLADLTTTYLARDNHPAFAFCADAGVNDFIKTKPTQWLKWDGTVLTTDPALPTSVTISPKPLNLSLGETRQMTATVLPSGASQAVTWSSSNPAVATVSSSGLVTMLTTATVGQTSTITATTANALSDSTVATASNQPPLRVATVYNTLAYDTMSPGAETDSYLAMPFIIAGDRKTLTVGDYAWIKMQNQGFADKSSSLPVGNGHTILQATIIVNGITQPVKYNGQRSNVVADGTPEIIADEFSAESYGFSNGIIPDGTIGCLCWEMRLPSTSAKIGTTDKYLPIYGQSLSGSTAYAWQCISYNPATTTLSSIDTTNPIRTVLTGTATTQNKWKNPIILGRPVSDSQEAHGAYGDSITQGVQDDRMPAIYGVGYFGRLVESLTKKIPYINFGVSGRYAVQSLIDARTGPWMKYVKTTSIMLPTNDFGLGRTTGIVSDVWTAMQQIVAGMRSYGVQKVAYLKIPPYTTGSWGTEADQVVGLNYTAGGKVDQFNALVDASAIFDMIIAATPTQGTDPRKWYAAFGATTADGVHPNKDMDVRMAQQYKPSFQTLWL